jgi:hypothetical protein
VANQKHIREHLEVALMLAAEAEAKSLAYIIEMVRREIVDAEVGRGWGSAELNNLAHTGTSSQHQPRLS